MTELIAWSLVAALGTTAVILLLRLRTSRMTPLDIVPTETVGDAAEREIVERSREGVILLNHALTPIMANASARAMLGFAPGGLPATVRSDELESLARRAVTDASV